MNQWWAATAMIAMCAAAPAVAETIELTANLTGGNEVPPVETRGSGSASVVLDSETRELRWVVQYDGLTAPMTAVHFHGTASRTQNAPVVVPIAKTGDASPHRGSATLTPDQADSLLAGRWYINVHTPTYPPGELRGQVVKR